MKIISSKKRAPGWVPKTTKQLILMTVILMLLIFVVFYFIFRNSAY